MDPYELRAKPMNTPPTVPATSVPTDVREDLPPPAMRARANPIDAQQSGLPGEVASVLRALATVQRQQSEQTHLLRRLLAEIELLKAAQTQQGSTVTRLDRRMRWARVWRLSWLVLRIAFFGGIAWLLVYLIGMEQIQAMWERLLWLFT